MQLCGRSVLVTPHPFPFPNILNDLDCSLPKFSTLSDVFIYLPIPPAFAAVAYIRLLFSHIRIGETEPVPIL